MWSSITKTRALNTQSRYRATECDRAKLGNAKRHEAIGEGRRNEVFIGGHATHFGGPSNRIDFKNVTECAYVQTGDRPGRAASKKVAGCLG